MVSFLVGTAGAIIGLLGWYKYHSLLCLILGVVAALIEDVLEEDNLNSNAKTLNLSAFVVGAVVASIRGVNPWYVGGLLAVNILSAVFSLLGIGLLFCFFKK